LDPVKLLRRSEGGSWVIDDEDFRSLVWPHFGSRPHSIGILFQPYSNEVWLCALFPNEVKDAAMQIILELPEDIVQELRSKWKDLPRLALESLALEAYRSHALTAAQLPRLLGFETRMQVDAFLKEHEVYDFTAADFEQDRETLRQIRAREAQH
jgi:hypothetical protein